MAKYQGDDRTQDWVDADERRRRKEEDMLVRRKLRKEKHARKDSESIATDRPRSKTPR